MSRLTDAVDLEFEAEDKPRAIVAIPARWPHWMLHVAPLLGVGFGALGLWLDSAERQAHGSAGWILAFWPLALVLFFAFPAAIMLGRGPEFAVLKDGLKMPFNRFPPGRSIWDRWSYGFYSWSEVSYCRWSPYQAGVLSIHLQGATQGVPAILGTGSDSQVQVPPMIYFYRVPERHRAAVEAAIRACGKWVD
jgi:hypothetical protein